MLRIPGTSGVRLLDAADRRLVLRAALGGRQRRGFSRRQSVRPFRLGRDHVQHAAAPSQAGNQARSISEAAGVRSAL